MNLAKSKKIIAKKAKMGFRGFPEISIAYAGPQTQAPNEVIVTLVTEEGADPLEQRLQSETDAREDEVIQSTIVKIIERSDAASVIVAEAATPSR